MNSDVHRNIDVTIQLSYWRTLLATGGWWLVAGGWWVIVGVIQYDWPHVPTNTPARDQPHFYPSQEYLISSICYLLYDFHPWILLSASIVCTSLAAADAGAGCPWLPRPGRQVTPDTWWCGVRRRYSGNTTLAPLGGLPPCKHMNRR